MTMRFFVGSLLIYKQTSNKNIIVIFFPYFPLLLCNVGASKPDPVKCLYFINMWRVRSLKIETQMALFFFVSLGCRLFI